MHFNVGRECESCNLLRDLLEEERTNNRRLMDKLLSLTNPVSEVREVENENKPVAVRPMTFRVRRTILEAEDRAKARLIREKEQEIANTSIKVAAEQTVEELEKELGVG